MADRIQLRRDTAANWTTANPILAQGEPGIETDTLKIKLGDGVTAWNSLPYYTTGDQSLVTYEALNANGDVGFSSSQVPPGDDVLSISGTLSEFSTEQQKYDARQSLDLNIIDCGTFN